MKNVQNPASQGAGNFSCWKWSQVRIRSNLQAVGSFPPHPWQAGLPRVLGFNPCTQLQNICRGQKQGIAFQQLLHPASDQHTTAWNNSPSWLTRKTHFLKKALSKGTCLCQTPPGCSAHLPGLLFVKTKANIMLAGIPPSLCLSKSSAMFLI